MGRRSNQTFLQRRHTDGQQAHEKMLIIANYQRNANQNYNEIPPHTNQKDYHQEIHNKCQKRVQRKGSPLTLLVVIQIGAATKENSMQVSQNLTYNSSIPLLNIYPDKTVVQKDICTPMFIAVLFTIAKTWKPKCPSTDEWIKKMQYIYTTEYYSPIKRKNNAICSNMDGPRDYRTK